MNLNFSAKLLTVTIEDNDYTLPDVITPKIRALIVKQEAALRKALNAEAAAQVQVSKAAEGDDIDALTKAIDDLSKATVRKADAARDIIGILLKTPEGQPAPASALEAVADTAADYATTLVGGARVDASPEGPTPAVS